MIAPTVFISYSHRDEEWKDRLLPHLKMLEQVGRIVLWDDRQIDAGADWYDKIRQAIEQATVAICLISAHYLSSDFVVKEEIPYLLERRERDGMNLIPVLLRPCPWPAIPWLKKLQMLPRDARPVSSFRSWDKPLSEVVEHILNIIDNLDYQIPKPSPQRPLPQKIDIGRLPMTGAELFGRQKKTMMLDEAWETGSTNVVSLVAWGGVGKSTLVNKWLERMAIENYRGARMVYGWSFYSQGTGERVTSADQFISAALIWFGDSDPTVGSPWAKGKRLADLIRQGRNLLVLDGLESLQSYLDYERGKVKDPALAVLLTELARENPGLCIITTREMVADLASFSDSVHQESLEHISDEAGRALLRVAGVRGTDAELEQTTRNFGNHALALNLLATYLHDVVGHSISQASEIPDLDIPEEKGRYPRRIISTFEKYFGDGPEVETMRILSLFDRSIDIGSIAALKVVPPIPGFTDHIQMLSDANWVRLIQRLRRFRLVAPESSHKPNDIDCHPLIREHFGDKLSQKNPNGWREANSRLYDYYKTQTKEYPDTLEEMVPLFDAITHGCKAGRHQEALEEIYKKRIYRIEGRSFDRAMLRDRLGAVSANAAVISCFFSSPWEQPAGELTEEQKAFVLSEAGEVLRVMGRLGEAMQQARAAMEIFRSPKNRIDYANAAQCARRVIRLYLDQGYLHLAESVAQESVWYANQCQGLYYRMRNQAALANVIHQVGRLGEAARIFQEAEMVQQEMEPDFPFLPRIDGAYYFDLLLDLGEHGEILRRTKQTINWPYQKQFLVASALHRIAMGRAYLLETVKERTNDFQLATDCIEQGMEELRHIQQSLRLPRGLLAHAELCRVIGISTGHVEVWMKL